MYIQGTTNKLKALAFYMPNKARPRI